MDKPTHSTFSREINVKALRKIKAKREGAQGVWTGLGMMGLIGWSVSLPTLLGVTLGFWLDGRFPGPHSWTLTAMLVGLVVGCITAWHWIRNEHKEMDKSKEDTND